MRLVVQVHRRRSRIFALGAVIALTIAGCGMSGAPKAPTPAERVLLQHGAQQYAAAGNPHVTSATCRATSAGHFTCRMEYDFTPPGGHRGALAATVPVTCNGASCAAAWGSASTSRVPGSTYAPRAATTSAATGPNPSRIAALKTCLNADRQYLTLTRDVQQMTPNASQTVFSRIVADSNTYLTELREVGLHATPSQQAQLQQYEGVIGNLQTAARDASAGDLQSADEQLVGIGPQIGKIPALVNQICKTP